MSAFGNLNVNPPYHRSGKMSSSPHVISQIQIEQRSLYKDTRNIY